MLKMMSELNQDIKVANHDIGRSVAYMAAKVKLRDGIIKKSASSREQPPTRLNEALKDEIKEYLGEVSDLRMKTNSFALCSNLY